MAFFCVLRDFQKLFISVRSIQDSNSIEQLCFLFRIQYVIDLSLPCTSSPVDYKFYGSIFFSYFDIITDNCD